VACVVPATGIDLVLKNPCAGVETQGMKNQSSSRLLALCFWFATLLFSHALSASTQQFQASWEKASWKFESGAGQCALIHTIPHFGRACFEQVSGHRLQFSLNVDQPLARDHKARLRSEAPAWKHVADNRVLGSFDLKKGKTSLRVPRDQVMQIYRELENGMQPVIEISDWGDGHEQVKVVLPPVRFREASPKFLECTAGLLHLDFEPISEKAVYFSSNSDRLSRAARRTLEQIARDYRKRKDFRVVLGGYADARGEPDYNMDLSRRRTAMAARFLRSRGVDRKAIESRNFGESQPRSGASGDKAWARSRRVTIWLAN